MKLGLRPLNGLVSVNSFTYATDFSINKGSVDTLYFQLVDLSTDLATGGYSPAGRRYIPPASSTLRIMFTNIDDDKKIVRPASQVYPTLDASIWSVPVFATDSLDGTVSISLTLNQSDGKVLTGFINAGVLVC